MTLLAEIRAKGTIRVHEGELKVSGDVKRLLPSIKANRAALIAAIEGEAFGTEYHNHKLSYLIAKHYEDWCALPDSDAKDKALKLLLSWDDLCALDIALGAETITQQWPDMQQLIDNRPMSGEMLHGVITQLAAREGIDDTAFGTSGVSVDVSAFG